MSTGVFPVTTWLEKIRHNSFVRSRPRPTPQRTPPVKRPMSLEVLEDRLAPATLNIVGGALTFTDSGAEANNLTVSVSSGVYSFNDAATNITLGSGATAAGWRGAGTKTVSGPAAAVTGTMT